MRHILLSICLILSVAPTLEAQSAIPLLERSIAAHQRGSTVIADIVAMGTIQKLNNSTETVTIYTKGLDKSRMDYPQSKRVRVTQGEAGRKELDQRSEPIPRHTVRKRIGFFPLLDLVAALSPGAETTYQGLQTLGSVSVHRVSVRIPDTERDKRWLKRALDDEFELYLDASSLLVVRSIRWQRAVENLDLRVPSILDFSDYRQVSGVLIPFQSVNTVGNATLGLHRSGLTLSSVRFNQGLPDSLFDLEGGRP